MSNPSLVMHKFMAFEAANSITDGHLAVYLWHHDSVGSRKRNSEPWLFSMLLNVHFHHGQ